MTMSGTDAYGVSMDGDVCVSQLVSHISYEFSHTTLLHSLCIIICQCLRKRLCLYKLQTSIYNFCTTLVLWIKPSTALVY